jgi:hypothetical protein
MKDTWFKEKLDAFKGDAEFEFEGALLEFEERLARNIKPMPPEFAEVVSKHFWELFDK